MYERIDEYTRQSNLHFYPRCFQGMLLPAGGDNTQRSTSLLQMGAPSAVSPPPFSEAMGNSILPKSSKNQMPQQNTASTCREAIPTQLPTAESGPLKYSFQPQSLHRYLCIETYYNRNNVYQAALLLNTQLSSLMECIMRLWIISMIGLHGFRYCACLARDGKYVSLLANL